MIYTESYNSIILNFKFETYKYNIIRRNMCYYEKYALTLEYAK